MSSGALPFHTYHRASQLGSGTYGDVVCVYNDDGIAFALKLFLAEDEASSDESSNATSSGAARPIDLGALREISCLRLLRGENAHPNIATLVDVQPEWQEASEEGGAGTSGCLSMALPLYRSGSLQDALENKSLRLCPKRTKVALAHGLLSAVAYLHDNDFLHRDIKPDNVMLQPDDDDGWSPVLIDFSLAKRITSDDKDPKLCHTGEIGTVTYTAPEVVAREHYGKPSDLWSVGVVLLELLLEEPMQATKDRHASNAIASALAKLKGDLPFPRLIKALLQQKPQDRLTARQALEHELFEKFEFSVPEVRLIDIATALPLEVDQYGEDGGPERENDSPNNDFPLNKKHGKAKRDRVLEKRAKFIDGVCRRLNSQNPVTPKAALEYCRALSILDDEIDNVSESQSLLNCAVLAFRFFEVDVLDLEELDQETTGTFAKWNIEDYVDDEATIFMILEYCLYPRTR